MEGGTKPGKRNQRGSRPPSQLSLLMTQIKSLVVVELSRYPAFFLPLEVRDCWNTMGPMVQAALDDVAQKCTRPGTPEHRKALYMHQNPAGNLYTLSFGLCEAERLPYLVRYIDYILTIDDVFEDLPHQESAIEHNILSHAVRLSPASSEQPPSHTANTRLEWVDYLVDLGNEMMSLDPIRTPSLIETFEEDLKSRDSFRIEFESVNEYIPRRLQNFDWEAVTHLVRWAMDIDISPTELDSDVLVKVKYSTGVIASLSNDYFSWEREKMQHDLAGSRIWNAVAVLMKEHNVSESEAKAGVKSIILEEEVRLRVLIQNSGDMTAAAKRYINGLQVLAGGYSFWCATCPRYSKPDGDTTRESIK
ncbi:hypothetical protein PM082_020937 [Marasmius tenuissimus]|nr:hypothetical protein PM082_020937 [Marasmius tenuissimus]